MRPRGPCGIDQHACGIDQHACEIDEHACGIDLRRRTVLSAGGRFAAIAGLSGVRASGLRFGRSVAATTLAISGLLGAQTGRGQSSRLTGDFSALPPGAAMPDGWQEQRFSDRPGNRFRLVAEGALSVLQIESRQSASSLIHRFSPPVRATHLAWRWRTDAWPAYRAGFGEKAGDDFSLRLYLMFDYPLDRVPFAQRLGLRLAQALHGEPLPGATLCYVADPRAAAGTLQASPYTGRVQLMVLRSAETPGVWWSEQRDLVGDFQRAFGAEYGPGMPPLAAVALAADTDQSGGSVRAWFSDLQWSPVR